MMSDDKKDITEQISQLREELISLKQREFIDEYGDLRGNIYQDIDGDDRWIIITDIVFDTKQNAMCLEVLEIFDDEIFNINISLNLLMESTQRVYKRPHTKIWKMVGEIIRAEKPLAI